ncbi:ArsA family ATPase [Haloarcula onubensis]|uniref:ArsA family ATPase n=1 Tax=Haloarcula onubensis TaxID=2950539 RepID=A0ABU2FQU8_9EURY|nr:ArsA family ATPase [Halomicroarcula sp. S3CR25-11]MDS0283139.1 ArsA family ATPase [Halomicroarcula sp. S3CR25-11]
MTQFVLYGGKGGVGKTTVAAATGLRLADAGHETLVVSTDPAHSLGDAVAQSVGPDPVEIRERLWGVEVDPQAGIDRYEAIFEALAEEFADAGIRLDEEQVADLFTSGVLPGSDELAAVDGMADYVDSDRFERVVFDTAPTGHTLRLLDLPEVMDRGMATALDLRDQVRRKVDTARTMVFGPMGRKRREEADDFTAMRDRMERVGEALRDPERTEFRVVTIPETMAVRESERLVAQLRAFEVPVTTLVVNKVIDDPGDCERCRGKQAVQEESLAALQASLPELDVWTVPDEAGEVTGLAALERVGANLVA